MVSTQKNCDAFVSVGKTVFWSECSYFLPSSGGILGIPDIFPASSLSLGADSPSPPFCV